MIKESDFTYQTNLKGYYFGDIKITNKRDYVVFYKGEYCGLLSSKKDAINYIRNLVEHQKLIYTQIY